MPRKPGSKNAAPPKYRHHKASGRGVVTVAGKVRYLDGPYNSAESRSHYHRLMSQLAATGGIEPVAPGDENGPTVTELIASYWTNEVLVRWHGDDEVAYGKRMHARGALDLLADLYGPTRAKDFDPAAYLAYRDTMIRRGKHRTGAPLSRKTINAKTWTVIQMFKWGHPRRLVPSSIYHDLMTVGKIMPNEGGARVAEPVLRQPADPASVDAALPYLTTPLQAAVRLQRLTGMRTTELLVMRGVDIDTTPDAYGNWTYRPTKFKNQRRKPGYVKPIPLGPAAREIVAGLLKPDLTAYLITPVVGYCEGAFNSSGKARMVRRRPQKGSKSRVRAGRRYSNSGYTCAVMTACDRAEAAAHRARPDVPMTERLVPRFHPHMLRHLHATEVETKFDLETAAAALDHTDATTTRRYTHARHLKAQKVAADVG